MGSDPFRAKEGKVTKEGLVNPGGRNTPKQKKNNRC